MFLTSFPFLVASFTTIAYFCMLLLAFLWGLCICEALFITHELDDVRELSSCSLLTCLDELLLPGLREGVENTLVHLHIH
jgi:hypothetical protein